MATELKTIYRALNAEEAQQQLERFAASALGKKYPMIAESWARHWEEVIPFFAYPMGVRKMIYTTNAIESLNMQVRKVIKNRGHFPSDEAAAKLIYLALRNITTDWGRAAPDWKIAMNQFAILYADRFTKTAA